MTDLPDRILEAIAETERIARATTGGGLRGWHTQSNADLHLVDGYWRHIATSVYEHKVGHAVVEDARTDFAHMAHNDPKITLRRCEADKRTVDLHVPNWSVIADSPYVDAGGNPVPPCKHCKWAWPCPDLLDRASAYDIEAP